MKVAAAKQLAQRRLRLANIRRGHAGAGEMQRRHEPDEGEQQAQAHQDVGHGLIEAKIEPDAGEQAVVEDRLRRPGGTQRLLVAGHRRHRRGIGAPRPAEHGILRQTFEDRRKALLERCRAFALVDQLDRPRECPTQRRQPAVKRHQRICASRRMPSASNQGSHGTARSGEELVDEGHQGLAGSDRLADNGVR